ncbi:hypothetical protein [Carboxylicivirga sp. RSCT41]|uniref:hypothetical protein n=1 Tax=Carboxylicivirga agarovorans TaxID=3417570 RepID=UPI003D32B0CE
MKVIMFGVVLINIAVLLSACTSDNKEETESQQKEESAAKVFSIGELSGDQFIADYTVAKEGVLRSIPKKYIDLARQNLHVAYQHTSHGTHVSRGLYGLQDYKEGDDVLFGITNHNPQEGKLDFRDYALQEYAEPGRNGVDLSRDETAFIQATRNYLDDEDNADINVVMWSWCNIAGHDVSGNYLPGMKILIDEYGVGGSKLGNEKGQRKNAVAFIFMTGHANRSTNTGVGNPKEQARLINDYCNANGLLCLDYYSIDTHCMNDNYWEDAGDNGDSGNYGGNFYEDWQSENELGIAYFESKNKPGGEVKLGSHTTQYITSNRKAYAMWWILARLSGWDGEYTE